MNSCVQKSILVQRTGKNTHMHLPMYTCHIYCFTHLVTGSIFCRTMIDTIITEGKIVPSEITIKLLQEAIIKGGNDKYIIDGFPRNEENRVVFESVVSLLSLHCFE